MNRVLVLGSDTFQKRKSRYGFRDLDFQLLITPHSSFFLFALLFSLYTITQSFIHYVY